MNVTATDAAPVMTTLEKALAAASAAQDKKGQAVTLIDVEGRCSYADIIMIVSATSERATLAIADGIASELRRQHRLKATHREGQGSWVLIDYGDLLIHVFLDEARAYYDLDTLWSEAPRISVPAPEHRHSAPAPSALSQRQPS